ncbi:MAG TPA: glycosyltransferase [Chitinispirillaceae bacterium]|nr:glycosyltransferase [Chitinispirillaceae bacterium]
MQADYILQKKTIRKDALSVCMIVKNESANIQRSLQNLNGVADELVVVDTGSTDSTVETAKEFGAKIICDPWRQDFSWSRNISLQNATCQWILWLDADDSVPIESLDALNKLKKEKPDRVFSFIVRNEHPGNTGTEFFQARMFPNHPQIRFERSIHEQITPSAFRLGMKLEKKNIVIYHHGYSNPVLLKQKAHRNLKMLIKEYKSIGPDQVMAVEIADSYLLVEDYSNSRIWYDKVLQIAENSENSSEITAHAYLGLGNILNKKEKFNDAINVLEKAKTLLPSRPDILYSLSVACDCSKRIPQAIEYLKKIPELNTAVGQVGVDFRMTRIKAYLRLTRILVENQMYDEAKETIKDALGSVANRPEIHNIAGKYYLKTGKLLDSLHEFEKSLQIRKEGNLDAYIGLCLIYRIAGKNETAIQTINSISSQFLNNLKFQAFTEYFLHNEKFCLSDEYESILEDLKRDFFGML